MTNFGAIFHESLRKRGITQAEAAKRLNMTQEGVSYYCRLKKPPRFSTVQGFSVMLGIPSEELLGEDVAKRLKEKSAIAADKEISSRSPWITWGFQLRLAWRKSSGDRHSIELGVRTVWPDQAEKIIAWLNETERK